MIEVFKIFKAILTLTKNEVKKLFPSAKYSGKKNTWYVNGRTFYAFSLTNFIFW